MCTVTAERQPEGWLVTMNRDEARARPDGMPPYRWPSTSMVAPQDPATGGTWIGARADGVWACLLNGYLDEGDEIPIEQPETRGRIIPTVLACPTPESAIDGLDLSRTHAFRLWVGTDFALHEWFWDQRSLTSWSPPSERWYIATSSSHKQTDVAQARKAVFERFVTDGAPRGANGLPLFHVDPAGLDPSHAVPMAREHSHTKSITQIIVSSRTVRMKHWSEGTFDRQPSTDFTLERTTTF